MQDVHDAAVLDPRLVVEEPAQLRRELGNGALRVLAGFEPVIVYAPGAGIGAQRRDGRLGENPLQQPGQLLLPIARHQEVPERTKAPSWSRIRDGVTLAHDVFEQAPLDSFPQRNAFPAPPVRGGVLLHFPEIGEKVARELHELLEPILERGVVEQWNVTTVRALDFAVQRIATLVELSDPYLRIGFGALAHLSQQLEQRQQARFGPNEAALRERGEPGDCLLGGRRQIELRLVGVLPVELAQPSLLGAGPVVEIVERTTRKRILPRTFPQRVELVLQCLGQVTLRQEPLVGRDEHAVEKACRERRVVGTSIARRDAPAQWSSVS